MIDAIREARILVLLRGSAAERDVGLRELHDATRRALFGIALRMTGRADLAEDAVQEAFIDVLHGVDGFRGEARFTTWLYRIMIRAATRVAARARRRPAEPLSAEPEDASAGPSTTAESRDGAARIIAAIAKLPAPQRAVLALAALDGLPQTEIARVLGVPEGTVHSRLHTARERLRRTLERQS